MKKLILTIAMATSGLGGLVTSAQAHEFCREHECHEHGYCYPHFYYHFYWDDDDCGYWYWYNGHRYWRHHDR